MSSPFLSIFLIQLLILQVNHLNQQKSLILIHLALHLTRKKQMNKKIKAIHLMISKIFLLVINEKRFCEISIIIIKNLNKLRFDYF